MEMDNEGMAKRSCNRGEFSRQSHMSLGAENVWPQGPQDVMLAQNQMAYSGQIAGGQGDMEMGGFGPAGRGQCSSGIAQGQPQQQQQWPIAQVCSHLIIHVFVPSSPDDSNVQDHGRHRLSHFDMCGRHCILILLDAHCDFDRIPCTTGPAKVYEKERREEGEREKKRKGG